MSSIQDALSGITFSEPIDDDELVSDAVVIVRLIHKETGRESFTIANSDGIGALMQLALVVSAHDVIRNPAQNVVRSAGSCATCPTPT